MATADVTVRGAGIFGLSIAWACTRRGARVQVIDPGGVGAGASGGIVGALAPHVPETWNPKKAFQFESLVMAESFWAEVDATSGQSSGYARTGRLQPVADDAALTLARARSETARTLWQDHASWRVIPLAAAGPWAPLSPTGWLIHDTLTARLHPRQACASLAAAIRALGGTIAQDGDHHGPVIWATGTSGLDALSAQLGKTVGTAVKGQALLLDHAAPDAPQLFADTLHIVPRADGTTAIGSTSERDFTDPTGTDAALDALHARVLAACPPLAGAKVLERWAGQRPRARSRAPMLGPWPGRPGHFIANGGFKIGFGMAPKIAETMADLVLDNRDTIPPDFRVEASL